MHGVGSSVVNALSTKLEAWVQRDGNLYYQSFSLGISDGDIEIVGKSKTNGTTIKFYPDASIFKITTEFEYMTIVNRMRQQAYLTKGIKLEIIDERKNQAYKFYFE